ncbi:MAG: alpha/beta hydrolase [Alphaproteobacteria bacterium]
MELQVRGKSVYAATGGKPFDASLPVVLFIHGAAFDHATWKLQTRYFAWHDHAVLAVDLPGHGRSEGPLIETVAGMADWACELLDTAGVKAAMVVGHSMGALVALDMAARHPDRVSKLGLCGCAAKMPVNDTLLGAAKANDHAALEMVTSWGTGRAARTGGNRVPGTWLRGGGLRQLERAAPGVMFNDMNACNAFADGPARAADVKCPTVVIAGGGDLMTPAKAGKALADAIAGATCVVIPGAGHMMMDETPDETLDALIAAFR